MIRAAGNVTCEGCDANDGYGNFVKVDHGDGIVSVYGHLKSVNVKVGDIVGINTQIGTMGSTGNSTGAHLHFAVERNGSLVDPELYLGKETSNLNENQFASYCRPGGVGGTFDDPWGGKTADDLGKPKIKVKQYVGGKVETSMTPGPEITYIDNMTPGQVTVYGLGIYKYEKADYKYEKESCRLFEVRGKCFLGSSKWETVEESEKALQNTQIALYIEGQDKYTYVADLWNDTTSTKGRWATDGSLNGDSDPILPKYRQDTVNTGRKLKYGDKVCVKSVIFESFPHGEYLEAYGNCQQVDVAACTTTASGYDRCKAGEYARQYGEPGARNPSYFNYNGEGGNCTNFASQVLHEGGKLPELTGGKVDQYWYYNSTDDRTATWAGAQFFYNHMYYWSDTLKDRYQRVSPVQSTTLQEEFYSLEIGDVVSLYPYSHNMVVSDIDNDNIYIAANTYNFSRAKVFGDGPSQECLDYEEDINGPKLPCFHLRKHTLTLFKVK